MHRRSDCIVQGASEAAANASASALREVHFIGCGSGRCAAAWMDVYGRFGGVSGVWRGHFKATREKPREPRVLFFLCMGRKRPRRTPLTPPRRYSRLSGQIDAASDASLHRKDMYRPSVSVTAVRRAKRPSICAPHEIMLPASCLPSCRTSPPSAKRRGFVARRRRSARSDANQ